LSSAEKVLRRFVFDDDKPKMLSSVTGRAKIMLASYCFIKI